ncbi:MAG: chemotaxis protein CheW [Alphaproteobacteria bacterium]|nr:chemotaxis protein CheW [Alphaproteobacteria bacterium]
MDELVVEFLTETNESIQELDLDIVHLEQNPNDKNLLSKIFRLMHTIKGTCGFLGLPRLEKVAHRAENVLGRFRDGDLEVTPAYVTLILESIDRIKLIVSGLEQNGAEPEGDDTALIEKLDSVYEGRDTGASTAATAPASTPEDEIFVPVPAFATGPAPEEKAEAKPEMKAEIKTEHKEDAQKESALAAQTLRVNVDVIENLMTMVSELVLTRNQLLQISRTQTQTDFSAPLQRLNQVVSELQEGVMKTRMQPIGNAWAKLPRIIRDLAHELGKKIDLVMEGQETELDRQVLELIKDPLTHMVRNSADHGIEDPKSRATAGKNETGKILLQAFHEGGHIIIRIADDGKGLPLDKIRRKILKNGLATEEELAQMTPQQIQQFIFRAGFSTAEQVTSVSGRGVGMDVVRTNIERIGGSIELKSVEGKGSTFTIKIPLTLAIVSALIVESAGERFAIPQLAVRELVMVSSKSESKIETIRGAPVLRLRDRLLPLVSLSDLLKLKTTAQSAQASSRYIVVTQVGAYAFGIIVDRVFDTEEIVVKPVAKILRNLDLFSGNTILGDGSVIMILDPNGIARATGEIGSSDSMSQTTADDQDFGPKREKVALLLFSAGGSAPKAVPLSLVARLESIQMEHVENSSGQHVIQYRGHLMPLVSYGNSDLPSQGEKPVLVFSDKTHTVGIVVDEIIDIAEEYLEVELASDQKGLLGSAILHGKATDVIDVAYFLSSVNKNWFRDHGNDAYSKGAKSGARRILLVDDSPFFRNMLTPLLTVAGYQVTSLESAGEALKMCDRGEKFDVIISDIEMPDMDGFEFAQKVKAGSNWQNTPMVALTSHATAEDVNRGFAVGFKKYVAKFDRDTLLSTLSETITEQKMAAE